MMTTELLLHLDTLADGGQLRRLGSAFARFIASLGVASPALTVASALLSELEGRGHSCLLLDTLADDPGALLDWPADRWPALRTVAGELPDSANGWHAALAACPQVWCVGSEDNQQPLVLDGMRLYLRRYWHDETRIAATIHERAEFRRELDPARVRRWLDRLFDSAPGGASLDTATGSLEPDWQKLACAIALRSQVAVVTGGPGTGKTYTVARLLALLCALADDSDRLRVALAAPTGKAAARLKQSIDSALGELNVRMGDLEQQARFGAFADRIGAARTLHSLLGARPDTRAFRHNAANPLEVDVLIVDEASMVHLEMMAALLDALPPQGVLVLLGDKDQLASVEAGAVLGDLCREAQAGGYKSDTVAYALAASGERIPPAYQGEQGALAQQIVMLRQSRRFGGPIGTLATAVNNGDGALAADSLRAGEEGVLAWQAAATQAEVLQLALAGRDGAEGGYRDYLRLLKQQPAGDDPAAHEAWQRDVLQAFDRFRLLCAVREGDWGVAGLNQAIERRLVSEGWISRRSEWYVGRPVMITRNDYGSGVFNGDIGIALPDPLRPDVLRVYFLEGDKPRGVLASRLRDVETAYAMTVHKSQGSEFLHTVLVLPPEATPMLTRELVYTGITRARQRFTLVTPNSAVLARAIEQRTQRASGLRERLEE
jgi:exodeoxyribonuclease V alpha subunit